MDYLEKIKQIEQETPKPNVNWLIAWRELAQMTLGLTEEDPRFESVMRWLNACDVVFSLGSWQTFREAEAEVKRIVGTIDTSRSP